MLNNILNMLFKCHYTIFDYLSTNSNIPIDVGFDKSVNDYDNMNSIDRDYYTLDNDIESLQLVQKSYPPCFMRFNCGYCSTRVNVPCLMYNDNAFCSNECRNNQILYDNNSCNPYTRVMNRNVTI